MANDISLLPSLAIAASAGVLAASTSFKSRLNINKNNMDDDTQELDLNGAGPTLD